MEFINRFHSVTGNSNVLFKHFMLGFKALKIKNMYQLVELKTKLNKHIFR
jgi:hypothetical protein